MRRLPPTQRCVDCGLTVKQRPDAEENTGGGDGYQLASNVRVFASAGRAAARASPLPPPAKACWRFSGFESLPKIWPELATDRACNHASFAREPTHPTLTGGSGPRRRRLARSAHAIEAERGARRPRWRPPEAARDLRPHGVLRRRLVAGEVRRLQALPRVTALLTALLLAPQAGWPCQHAVLHCHVPVGSTAPLLVDRSQDRVRPRPCTACSRSHGALTHGVRAAQRVALPPRLRPLLLRPRLVPTHRRFVARPSRFRSRKGHWATARACTHWRGPRSTTSTRSVSARQAGRRVPRQYIRSDVQCPVRACSSV